MSPEVKYYKSKHEYHIHGAIRVEMTQRWFVKTKPSHSDGKTVYVVLFFPF